MTYSDVEYGEYSELSINFTVSGVERIERMKKYGKDAANTGSLTPSFGNWLFAHHLVLKHLKQSVIYHPFTFQKW